VPVMNEPLSKSVTASTIALTSLSGFGGPARHTQRTSLCQEPKVALYRQGEHRT
jgi:hypothetical protein